MLFDAYLPTNLKFGAGRFEEAGTLSHSLGNCALVVTSRSAMERFGYTSRLLGSLKSAGVRATVFRDLSSTPTTDDVDFAAEMARANGANLVIGLGGGSALDCAKAVAAVAPHRFPCADYLHGRVFPACDTLPILAIPTTSGTGSEMNRSAIVTDSAVCHKDAIRSDYMFPRIALVDPTLTYFLPTVITAQTGFDALAHAVESYVSPRAQKLADMLARDAMPVLLHSLPLALKEPNHAIAREQLALASTSMGFNLSCVGTCLPHRLDKPLCALFPQIAHGRAIALFYPMWIAASWRGNPRRFAEIARLIEPALADVPLEHAAAACASSMEAFLDRIGLKGNLASLGVNLDEEVIAGLAGRVRGDLQVNPVGVDSEQVLDFFRALQTPFFGDDS